MSEPSLAEVAADVAAALGLSEKVHNWTGEQIAWSRLTELLMADGCNLTDPQWRCACEDWLLDQGWYFSKAERHVEVWRLAGPTAEQIDLPKCPWPEAPARMVSAVWRRVQR